MGGTDRDGYRLSEDVILINTAVNDALYSANRYQELGFDHLEESTLEHLEGVREMVDETIERHSSEDADAETTDTSDTATAQEGE